MVTSFSTPPLPPPVLAERRKIRQLMVGRVFAEHDFKSAVAILELKMTTRTKRRAGIVARLQLGATRHGQQHTEATE